MFTLQIILNFVEEYRVRYLCTTCQIMFETKKYHAEKYKCRGCHPNFKNSHERYYINILRKLGFIAILQQYSDNRLKGVNGGSHRLRYDIAVFNTMTDTEPIFIIEKLSQNDFCKTNQDGIRDNYIKKVKFARDILKIPLIECGSFISNPDLMISEALEKYIEIKKINNGQQYYARLCHIYYTPIMNRMGSVHFE